MNLLFKQIGGCLLIVTLLFTAHAETLAQSLPNVQSNVSVASQIEQIDRELESLRSRTVSGSEQVVQLRSALRMRLLIRDLFIFSSLRQDDVGARAGVIAWQLYDGISSFDDLLNEMPDISRIRRNGDTPTEPLLLKRDKMYPLLDAFSNEPARKMGLEDVETIEQLFTVCQKEFGPLLTLLPRIDRQAASSRWPIAMGVTDKASLASRIEQVRRLFKLRLAGYPGHRQILSVLGYLEMAINMEDLRPRVEPILSRMEQVTDMLIQLRKDEQLFVDCRAAILGELDTVLGDYLIPARRQMATRRMDEILLSLPAADAINELSKERGPTATVQLAFSRAIELQRTPQHAAIANQMFDLIDEASHSMILYRKQARPEAGPLREAYLATLRAAGDSERQLVLAFETFAKQPNLAALDATRSAAILLEKRAGDVVRVTALPQTVKLLRAADPTQLEAVNQQYDLLLAELAGKDRIAATVALASLHEQTMQYELLLNGVESPQTQAFPPSVLAARKARWVTAWCERRPEEARRAMWPLMRILQLRELFLNLPTAEETDQLNRWSAIWGKSTLLAESLAKAQSRFVEIASSESLSENVMYDLEQFDREHAFALLLADIWQRGRAELLQSRSGLTNTLSCICYPPAKSARFAAQAGTIARLSMLLNELDETEVLADPNLKREIQTAVNQLSRSVLDAK